MTKPGTLNKATNTISTKRVILFATPNSKLGVTNVPIVATEA
ncbi:Uncharacterised protein [Chlamydia trachomatis]|nr:Uncharacterised protein [Chlamydia trachomatis]